MWRDVLQNLLISVVSVSVILVIQPEDRYDWSGMDSGRGNGSVVEASWGCRRIRERGTKWCGIRFKHRLIGIRRMERSLQELAVSSCSSSVQRREVGVLEFVSRNEGDGRQKNCHIL